MLCEKAETSSRWLSENQKVKPLICLDTRTSPNPLVKDHRLSSTGCRRLRPPSPRAVAAPPGMQHQRGLPGPHAADRQHVLLLQAGCGTWGCTAPGLPGAAEGLGPRVWKFSSGNQTLSVPQSQVELSGYYEAENTTPSLEGYFCFNPASSVVGNQRDPFRKVFMPLIYLLMFVLGTVGNALVLVILERFKRSRTTTENFLFHLTLANLALLLTFPFSVVESLAGWVFGKFLCKILSAVHKINFYCSSMLLGCIAVDRYLAIVYAIHTYRKRRARSIHLTCAAVWLCSLLLTLPDLIFMEVWTDDSNRSICYFPEVGIDGNNVWLATRFLYHTVGFFVPLLVMCYCYTAIVRALCQSQRLQRQKAVRVAILVTGVFLLCWSPYHIVIFLNTLTKLEAFTKNCLLEDQLDTAIMVTEAIGFTHCCLNPILYAFIGVKFRNDFFRILQELGCISQETLQKILEVTRKGSGIESDNTTSVSTF